MMRSVYLARVWLPTDITLLKVGIAADVNKRLRQLNSHVLVEGLIGQSVRLPEERAFKVEADIRNWFGQKRVIVPKEVMGHGHTECYCMSAEQDIRSYLKYVT